MRFENNVFPFHSFYGNFNNFCKDLGILVYVSVIVGLPWNQFSVSLESLIFTFQLKRKESGKKTKIWTENVMITTEHNNLIYSIYMTRNSEFKIFNFEIIRISRTKSFLPIMYKLINFLQRDINSMSLK